MILSVYPFSSLRVSAVDCDTSCIIPSFSTQRVLAVPMKSVELMPAEDVIHCVHLKRPVLMVKSQNLSKIAE